MSELSGETDALLQHGREGESLSSHDRMRLKRAVLAQVATVSVVATSTTAAAWTSVAAKMVGAVVIVGSVAGAAIVLPGRMEAPKKAARSAPTSVVANVPPLPATPLAPVVPLVPAPVAVPFAAPSAPSTVEPVAARPSPRAPLAQAAPLAETAPPSSLEQETQLFRDADDALKAGDAERTLRLLDDHLRRFPSSALEHERAAERVFALCSLGRRDEAKRGAGDFLRAESTGPLAARVRASCGGEGWNSGL